MVGSEQEYQLNVTSQSEHQSSVHWQSVFTSIIEDADSNILLLDDNFTIINLNAGFYWIFLETYGIELKRGTSILDAMKRVNPELTQVWHERCLIARTGTPVKEEEVFEMGGRTFYWEIHFKSTITESGTQILSVFSRDVTIRKAYQNRTLAHEANLRSILNTIEDSIWLVNTNFELIDFNKFFAKKYKQHFNVKVLRGVNVKKLMPQERPDLQRLWYTRYESGLRGRPGKYVDTYWEENEEKTYETKVYPIVENGTVTGVTVYERDITNQNRAENLLKQQNEELKKINEELDRFVYSASHDLRAPLMSIKGILNMVKLDPDKQNAEHYLSLIEKSVDKLDSFIVDIIHYSRNTRMDVLPKEINFHSLLQESIDSLKFMEGAKEVRTIRDIELDAPFYSDYSRLLILFNNIISNAVRYRDTWKEDSFIKVAIRTTPQKAIITFADNGIGIAPEYIESVFKMFFRASADSKGSGLGLYIVKGVIDKLNGIIQVKSDLGVGTTFTIEIPNLKGSFE